VILAVEVKLLRTSTLSLILLLCAASAARAGDAMKWLQLMSDAMRNLNYQGDFVYLHQNQLESMRIWHYRDDEGERERLISLNGEAREVLRDNRNLTCIWPSSRKVVVDQAKRNSYSPIFIPEDIARLEKFYHLSLQGESDRIGGAETVVVHIDPQDRYRYGIRFWINSDNGLMMKSTLIDDTDMEIEQVMFTNLRLFSPDEHVVIDTMPKIGDDYTRLQYHRGGGVAEVDSEWQVGNTPGGFWRESSLGRSVPGSDEVIWQMVFTDGLASLSVFIERQNEDAMTGGTSMGAVNAFIRSVDGHTVTAIGEVPAITVEHFAMHTSRRR